MWRLILVTFGFLAFAFYELSGGASFAPPERSAASIATPAPNRPLRAPLTPVVPPRTTPTAAPDTSDTPDAAAPAVLAAEATRQDDASAPALDITLASVTASDGAGLAAPVLASLVETAPVGAPTDTVPDVREITGNRVNMRNGPGTNHSVLEKLTQGEPVEVLQTPGNGWLKIRVIRSRRVGWMADFLVSADAR